MGRATVLFGVHGAGLTQALWLPQGAAVVQWVPQGVTIDAPRLAQWFAEAAPHVSVVTCYNADRARSIRSGWRRAGVETPFDKEGMGGGGPDGTGAAAATGGSDFFRFWVRFHRPPAACPRRMKRHRLSLSLSARNAFKALGSLTRRLSHLFSSSSRLVSRTTRQVNQDAIVQADVFESVLRHIASARAGPGLGTGDGATGAAGAAAATAAAAAWLAGLPEMCRDRPGQQPVNSVLATQRRQRPPPPRAGTLAGVGAGAGAGVGGASGGAGNQKVGVLQRLAAERAGDAAGEAGGGRGGDAAGGAGGAGAGGEQGAAPGAADAAAAAATAGGKLAGGGRRRRKAAGAGAAIPPAGG